MALSDFRLNGAALAKLLRGPQGAVMRHTLFKADRVKKNAQKHVGKDSHDLERSIVKRPGADGKGPFVAVGSFQGGSGYGVYHHEGTGPHTIAPRRASVLRFEVGGVVVFAQRVQHPGTRPNPYLVKAAQDEGLDVKKLAS